MSSYRILVVDDDPVQRDTLGEYLSLAGYDVLSAEDGVHALEMMAQREPDMVLLDVQMPEIDGFEVLERMRATPHLKDTPVLYLSSLGRPHAKIRGLELGADDYVIKPCNPAELLARIRAGLRRAAKYRKLAGALVGDIEQVGLDGLLQTLQIGMKRAKVKLVDLGAEIEVARGVILHASFRKHRAMDALQRMLLASRGKFYVEFDLAPTELTPEGMPVSQALVEALVAADEAKRTLETVCRDNPTVTLGPGLSGIDALEPLRSAMPLPVLEIILSLEGDLRDAVDVVTLAFESGALRVIT